MINSGPRDSIPAAHYPEIAVAPAAGASAFAARRGGNPRLGRRGRLRLAHRQRRIALGRQRSRRAADPRPRGALDRPGLCANSRRGQRASPFRRRHEIGQARRRPRRRLSDPILHPARPFIRNQALGRRYRPLVCRRRRPAGARTGHPAGHQRTLRARTPAYLSGAPRRSHRRTQSPSSQRDSRGHHRRSAALPLLLRLSSDRDRQPRPHQRILRFRHRRPGDRRRRQAHTQPDARQGHAGPLFRQKVRRRAARLHAGRHGDCGRSPAGRRARRDGGDQCRTDRR